MSPHAVPDESFSPLDLSEFDVTKNAFLPAVNPCKGLSNPYYQPWEDIVRDLPALVKSGIREAVSRLPILSTEHLISEPEWRRAGSILAYMTHAYVWGGQVPEEILPPQITVPFLAASAHLQLPPICTYAAANLWNFSSTTSHFTDIDDLSLLFSMTGTESEAWFLLISVAMEAQAGGIIPTLLHALDAVKTRDLPVITSAMYDLKACIDRVNALLARMHERCDPMVFYHQIRPLLAGSKNMASAGLPRGIYYDEGHGRGEWRQYRGPSNGQSSIIQLFDVFLGVDHKGNPKQASDEDFHVEMREYMPGPHRRFLTHLERMGSVRELALSEDGGLREAYQAAIASLAAFRDTHIQIVSRFIVLPSRRGADAKARRNLAALKEGEMRGTGGTSVMPFLKRTRDDTIMAGRLDRS